MTIREVSDALGLKVRTIRKWISDGRLKAEKQGKCWFVSNEVVYSEEVQERANKGREHSRRIKESAKLGLRKQGRQDSKKSVQRKKRKSK